MPETPFESSSDSTSDPFVARLAALAPAVDLDASRELFERYRARPVMSRRFLLPAAAVTLLIAGVVGVWAIARTGDSPTVPVAPIDTSTPTGTSIPDDLEPGDFEILLVAETSARAGAIVPAVDESELTEALRPITGSHDGLGVDFESSIVAVFNVFGNACPFDLVGFETTEGVWTPQLQGSEEVCDDIGITWAYVVAFDRSLFGSAVTFALPREDAPVDAPGRDGFEVIAVEQSQLPFGTIRAATDAPAYAALWSSDLRGAERPSVDFQGRFVMTFTVPGNACPDTLVEITDQTDDPLLWVPLFEPTGQECIDPLITWTYAVAIDRPPVDADITFRLPADDLYGYGTTEVTVAVDRARIVVRLDERDGGSAGPDAPHEPDLVATEVVLPLPSVGEPRLHTGTFGIVWVVQHDDGTVSVLDAVMPRSTDEGEDEGEGEGDVAGLGHLVRPTEGGQAFAGREYLWDAHGRTLNGPRTADLVGFAGTVADGEVQLFISNATRFDGEPDDPPIVVVDSPDLSNLPLLDLDELATLSFSGPVWRQLDATLVVQNGIGTLCRIDEGQPVPELTTCDTGRRTAVTSSNPDITSWYFGPLLAEFDQFGEINTIAPLGGEASRNDGQDGNGVGVPSGDGWRQLSRLTGQHFDGYPVVVVDDDGYVDLATSIGRFPLAPVDFHTSVVIAFGTASSPCLPSLATPFSPTGDWIEPRFESATETVCRASLVWYTFVIEIDRAQLGETIRLVVPESARPLGAASDTAVDDITFRVVDGALVAGGLRVGDAASAQCRDPGGPVLSVPVTSVDSRSFRLEFRVDGRVVWEAGGSGAPLTIAGGLNLSLVTAGPGEIIASSTNPPAEFRRPFELTQSELDELAAECG